MAKDVFKFRCPTCETKLAAKKEWAGRKVQCSKCNTVVIVPEMPETHDAAEPTGVAEKGQTSHDTVVAMRREKAVGEATRVSATTDRHQARSGDLSDDMGTIMRWVGDGLGHGLRNILPILGAAVIFAIVNIEAVIFGYVGVVFLTPPLVAGMVLLMLEAARSRKGRVSTLLSPFVDRGYWRSVGVFWVFAGIYVLAVMPLVFLGGAFILIGATTGPAVRGVVVVMIVAGLLAILYLMSRIVWAIPLVADRRVHVMESFRESWKITGRVGGGWGLFLLIIICKLIALIPTALVAALAFVVYRGVAGLLLKSAGAEAAFPSAMQAAGSSQVGGILVAAIVTAPLCVAVSAIVSMPIIVGYRESVPH